MELGRAAHSAESGRAEPGRAVGTAGPLCCGGEVGAVGHV